MENYFIFFNKYATKIALSIYLFGMAFALILFLILNMDFGEITFNNDIGSFFDIFIHNLKVQMFIFLGALLLGIPTVILLFINGFAIGMTVAQAIISGNIIELILHILPHGMFEIPGFLIISILSYQVLSVFTQEKKLRELFRFFNEKKYLFLLSFILTFIAALIEGI
ncbi:stage II sporulation protein M [Bacillus paramycoides]|uniref:stage II sporulation protein M n=1 Tax=Bacillus paramycoides TaxID=2026194 RepID=UPI0037F60B26